MHLNNDMDTLCRAWSLLLVQSALDVRVAVVALAVCTYEWQRTLIALELATPAEMAGLLRMLADRLEASS